MEPNIIAKGNGITIITNGHAAVIHDMLGESGNSVTVFLDKAVYEELQAMCNMAIHMVAGMDDNRPYTIAVFIARLFGGDVYTSLTETR